MYVHGSGNKRKIMPLVVLLQAVCVEDLQSQFVSHIVGLEWVDKGWNFRFLLLIESLYFHLTAVFPLRCPWFLAATPRHAAAWPRSCRCSSSTPWSTDPRTLAAPATTASSSPRCRPPCAAGLSSSPPWPLTLLSGLSLSLPSGSRRPRAVRRVGRDGLPEGERASQPP